MVEDKNSVGDIPKTIWLMWYDGESTAPEIVSACISSWRRHHPDWKLVILDHRNISDYLDIKALTGKSQDHYSVIVLSDILRINLLAQYGGVWADATCYCNQPLLSWLPPYMISGFFAFRNPGPDRELSSWFFAARPDSHLVKRYQQEINSYWRSTDFNNDRYPAVYRWLTRRLGRDQKTAGLWFSWAINKGLKIHPYFWSHYLFARLVTQDESCRAEWGSTPAFAASIPHALQSGRGLLKPMTPEMRALFDLPASPVYKLSWKYESNDIQPGSPLDVILCRERAVGNKQVYGP